MCYRARTPKNFSGARQHDDKEKICKKNFVATTKSNNPNFFTFVVFCCYLLQQQKNVAKMLPNNKGKIEVFYFHRTKISQFL